MAKGSIVGPQRPGRLAWALFWLSAAFVLVQAGSMVQRGSRGESDVGVFYRTCVLLRDGAGGDVYAQRDAVTGWPIAIPPAGTMLLQPFVGLGPTGFAVAWAAVNVGLCALSLMALRFLMGRMGERFAVWFPWFGSLFLALSAGSVQVGQFSVLFVSCWVVGLLSLAQGKEAWSGLCWALPGTVKVYPFAVVAAPLGSASGRKAFLLRAAWVVVWTLVVFVALPFAFYGARAWGLEKAFVADILLDPHGRMKWMQALGTTANQGLDAVMIRYLSYYPKFHGAYPWVPTARWDLDFVRSLGHAVRAVLVAVTLWTTMKWRRRILVPTIEQTVMLAGVWCAALYVCLPETRARYGVYEFLGYFPFASNVVKAWGQKGGWGLVALFGASVLLVAGVAPHPLDVLGFGLLGSAAVWCSGLVWLRSDGVEK